MKNLLSSVPEQFLTGYFPSLNHVVMKNLLTSLSSIGMLVVFCVGTASLSAALPDRSGVLKRRKDFEILQFIGPAYRQYVDDLTQYQTEYIAAQKFADAKRLQEEIQRNIGYVQQLGKSYQFIFASPSPLPKEGHLLRAARNHKIKLSVGNILKQYLAQQNKEQTFYLKGREFPKANAVQEEIKQATIELSRLAGIDGAIGKAVPQNQNKIPAGAKEFGGHHYKLFTASIPWDEAKKRCEEMGGYLACAETDKERKFLHRLKGKRVVWSGGSDNAQEGKFVWLNGKKVTLRVRDNNPERNKLILAPDGVLCARHGRGTFNNFKVKKSQGFICEWE
ncbi:MAG: C-type lectin domain-containing protein [Opitutales bacterium]